MSDTILSLAGSKSRDILVGPQFGADTSVLNLGNGRVMVSSCDPMSLIPSMGPEDSATLSIQEIASDVATSGVPPKYAMINLNLPPQISDTVLSRYWRAVHKASLKLGLSILGGHTGRFVGCDFSIVGSATMWAICNRNAYLTSSMAGDGDDLVLTKSAGFGATSVLARAFPRTVRRAIGASLFLRAWKYFHRASTVTDALTAVKAGIHGRGVTGMHDATEGGVTAALVEMAAASGLGASVDPESIPVAEETREICRFFHIDPLTSLGEGSLLIASRPNRTSTLIDRLASKGIEAHMVGRLSSKLNGVYATTSRGRAKIRYPTRDPYWKAYWTAVQRGWR